jgi:hypothetical protein
MDVFDSMGADPRLIDARTVLDWILRNGTSVFTRRELFNGVRGDRFPKVTDVTPTLSILIDQGYVRRLDAAPSGPARAGRRPGTRSTQPPRNPQNPQNPDFRGFCGALSRPEHLSHPTEAPSW